MLSITDASRRNASIAPERKRYSRIPEVLPIPDLIELQTNYQKKGIEVVGVSFDQNGKVAVEPFVKKNGVNYTMLLLAGASAGQTVAQQYGPRGKTPTMPIINNA